MRPASSPRRSARAWRPRERTVLKTPYVKRAIVHIIFIIIIADWLTHKKEYALGMWGLCDDAGTYTTLHITERPPQHLALRDVVLAEVAQAMKPDCYILAS